MERNEFFAAVGEDSEEGSLLIERLTVLGADIMEAGESLIDRLAYEMYQAIPQRVDLSDGNGFVVPWSMLTTKQRSFWRSAAVQAVKMLQHRLWAKEEATSPPEDDA